MSHRRLFTLALIVGLPLASPAAPPEAKPKEHASASALSMEVAALQTLHRFHLTAPQMEALRKVADETAAKARNRQDGKVSAAYLRTLTDLREALLAGNAERIDQLEEQLDGLIDSEDPEIDDEVELTPAARRRAAEVLRTLSPRQVAAFIEAHPEVPDPLDRLLLALDAVGKLKDDQWKTLVDELADELGWQLGGVDPDRSRFVAERVRDFLGNVRSLPEKELRKQRAELEKSARQFVGQVPPTVVLHNLAEHELAQLLSNPRLAAALDARLKK